MYYLNYVSKKRYHLVMKYWFSAKGNYINNNVQITINLKINI